MKKYTLYILILVTLLGLFSQAPKTHAQADFHCYDSAGVQDTTKLNQTDCQNVGKTWKQAAATPTPTGGGTTTTDKTYHYLAPLPGAGATFDPTQVDANGKNVSLGIYLNIIIKLFIGICAVLAVVMIVVGGLEYMTSELVNTKEQGRHRISGAIFGLVLALGAYTLLYTINPDLLNTDLSSLKNVSVNVTLDNQLKSYGGQGACTPVANSSNPCSAQSLANAGFTNATQASSICNGESGGDPSLASGVDKCTDGSSFSYGLFQVNILAHADEIPGGVCSGIFTVNGSGLGTCLKTQNGICIEHDCQVRDTSKFNSCVSYITNPTNNIAYAAGLQSSRGWGQWGANNSCHF